MTKQEKILREAIRREIRKELTEAGYIDRMRGAAKTAMDRMGKTQAAKILKRALPKGSVDQVSAALFALIKSVVPSEDLEPVLDKMKQKTSRVKADFSAKK